MMDHRIKALSTPPLSSSTIQRQTNVNTGADFGAIFNEELLKSRQVEFSKHAMERVSERGINIDDNLMKSLNDSVSKAEAKGVKNYLALGNDLAFIVNVPNNRVITAMSSDEMKQNIFTNIDGAIIL